MGTDNLLLFIIIRALGVIGVAISVIGFQCKKHNHILLSRTLEEFFFGIQYIILGAYTGATMNFLGCFRNQIFSHRVQKGKDNKWDIIIFSVIFTVAGILTWGGAKSILIIVAKVISTVAYGNKNPKIVRGLIFLTSTLWLIYNCFVGSYEAILCEAFTLVSIIVAIVRYDILKRQEPTKK